MLRIEGQLAFTKPHLFGQFILHQEPVVLDQTMTNLCTTEYNRPKIPRFYSHFILNMTCLNCCNL